MNKIRKVGGNFTTISNSFLRDSSLSFKAKGLFAYMFSMSDGWNFTIKSIATQQKDGNDSISSALKELKALGYVSYEKHNNGTGTYTLNDNPNQENPNQENPIMGKSTPIKKEQLAKKKNTYLEFIQELKSKVPHKSKVNKTKAGEELFKTIEDKEKLMSDYINHQLENGTYARRITVYMEDYYTVYAKQEKDEWTDGYDNDHLEWGDR